MAVKENQQEQVSDNSADTESDRRAVIEGTRTRVKKGAPELLEMARLVRLGSYTDCIARILEYGTKTRAKIHDLAESDAEQDLVEAINACIDLLYLGRVNTAGNLIDRANYVMIEANELAWEDLSSKEKEFFEAYSRTIGNLRAAKLAAALLIDDGIKPDELSGLQNKIDGGWDEIRRQLAASSEDQQQAAIDAAWREENPLVDMWYPHNPPATFNPDVTEEAKAK